MKRRKPVALASDRTPEVDSELLSAESGRAYTDEYSHDERLLNEFTKLHPMLSMNASSQQTMQLIATMTSRANIPVAELPTVTKSHDDMFLSPPVSSIGERACVCGDRCLAKFLAGVRYGLDNDMGFVCKEFLLPSQHRAFLDGHGLPAKRQKCLLCIRYYQTYLYTVVRTDPNFALAPGVAMQTFTNAVASQSDLPVPDSCPTLSDVDDGTASVSNVSCSNGYKSEAMLFVDQDYANTSVQRKTNHSALLFRPVVRFCSSHYRYVRCESGAPRIVQVNVSHDDHLQGLGFRQPPSPAVAAKAARASGH